MTMMSASPQTIEQTQFVFWGILLILHIAIFMNILNNKFYIIFILLALSRACSKQ